MPVASPWTIRATTSQPAPSPTSRKSPMARASSASAPAITGRRPRWSESDPAISRALSSATA